MRHPFQKKLSSGSKVRRSIFKTMNIGDSIGWRKLMTGPTRPWLECRHALGVSEWYLRLHDWNYKSWWDWHQELMSFQSMNLSFMRLKKLIKNHRNGKDEGAPLSCVLRYVRRLPFNLVSVLARLYHFVVDHSTLSRYNYVYLLGVNIAVNNELQSTSRSLGLKWDKWILDSEEACPRLTFDESVESWKGREGYISRGR